MRAVDAYMVLVAERGDGEVDRLEPPSAELRTGLPLAPSFTLALVYSRGSTAISVRQASASDGVTGTLPRHRPVRGQGRLHSLSRPATKLSLRTQATTDTHPAGSQGDPLGSRRRTLSGGRPVAGRRKDHLPPRAQEGRGAVRLAEAHYAARPAAITRPNDVRDEFHLAAAAPDPAQDQLRQPSRIGLRRGNSALPLNLRPSLRPRTKFFQQHRFKILDSVGSGTS